MKTFTFLLALVPLMVFGQGKPVFESDLQTEKKPWTHLNFANNPDDFQFAIVTDRTGGPRPGVFEDAVEKLNWLMPEFVISVGDLIRGAQGEDVKKLDEQWSGHFERIAPLKMPFFHLAGNHDIKANNAFQVEYWNNKFGAAYYSFVYKNVLFLNLFTNEGTQIISEQQVDYFKEVISKHPDVRWTMVFMHHPLWRYPHTSNFEKIEALLADRDYTVFAGHQHRYHHSLKNNQNYYVLATTGGGSELLGNSFGTFDHVTWVTLSDEGPVMANLRLDGILPHNVSNDETRALTQDLLRSIRVETTVLPDSETKFKKGIAYMTYQNTSEHPLHVYARFFHNHHVQVSPEKILTEIPPKTAKTIEIALEAIKPFHLEDNILLEYTGRIGYQLDEYPDLKLEGQVVIPLHKNDYNLLETGQVEFVGTHQVVMKKPLPGTVIRYTLDGSEPSGRSSLYDGPFNVSNKTTVKARLITKDGAQMSQVDAMSLTPIPAGTGLLVEYYGYEQFGRMWRGISEMNQVNPLKIVATQTLDPVKVAGRQERFGLIYKGQIDLPETGTYTFKAISDDAIRVLIDGKEVVADAIKHKKRAAFGKADFKAGMHDIEIQYFQWRKNYALELEFTTPGGVTQKVDSTRLSYGQQ